LLSEGSRIECKETGSPDRIKILCFWTSTVLFLFKTTTFRRMDSVSVFRLKPTQLGLIDRNAF
jgi:hypothetical protein